jgi:hypothetical protein
MQASEVKTDAFTKDNAIDYLEDEKETESARTVTYISSLTVEARNADGDTIGTITKLTDEDKIFSFTATDIDGNEIGFDGFETLGEAKQALADKNNKIQKKEFDKEQKKKAKVSANQGVLFDMNDPAFDIPVKKEESKYPPTSEMSKRSDFIDVCNFDLEKIKYILEIKNDVNKRAKRDKPVETVINFDDDDYYIFVVETFRLMQGKTGKEYLTMKVGDGISFTTLRAFEPTVKDLLPLLATNGIYVAEFAKNEKGYINFKRGTRIVRVDKDLTKKENE